MAVDEILSGAVAADALPRRFDLHLCGGRIGERELLERALLDLEEEPVVHSHADLDDLAAAVARSRDRAILVVIDAERRRDAAMTELAALRARRESRRVPIVVIDAGRDPDDVVAFYRAGASAVVHRSRFVDVWLRALREIIRFWARAALVPAFRTASGTAATDPS